MFTRIKPFVFAIMLVAGIQYVSAAWTSPSATPPNNNTDAPINVSDAWQSKLGALFINTGNPQYVNGMYVGGISTLDQVKVDNTGSYSLPSALSLGVNGTVGAKEYCDETGQNCFSASDVGKVITYINNISNTTNVNNTTVNNNACGTDGERDIVSAGQGSWSPPSGVSVNCIIVTVVGGGGGGGTFYAGGHLNYPGNGGGAGAIVKAIIKSSDGTWNIPYTVGSGGAGGYWSYPDGYGGPGGSLSSSLSDPQLGGSSSFGSIVAGGGGVPLSHGIYDSSDNPGHGGWNTYSGGTNSNPKFNPSSWVGAGGTASAVNTTNGQLTYSTQNITQGNSGSNKQGYGKENQVGGGNAGGAGYGSSVIAPSQGMYPKTNGRASFTAATAPGYGAGGGGSDAAANGTNNDNATAGAQGEIIINY